MPSTTDITLQHCITELERTVTTRREKYQQLVSKGKMTPYTRDFRLAVMERLLRLCKKAKAEKDNTLFNQLKQIHQ